MHCNDLVLFWLGPMHWWTREGCLKYGWAHTESGPWIWIWIWVTRCIFCPDAFAFHLDFSFWAREQKQLQGKIGQVEVTNFSTHSSLWPDFLPCVSCVIALKDVAPFEMLSQDFSEHSSASSDCLPTSFCNLLTIIQLAIAAAAKTCALEKTSLVAMWQFLFMTTYMYICAIVQITY